MYIHIYVYTYIYKSVYVYIYMYINNTYKPTLQTPLHPTNKPLHTYQTLQTYPTSTHLPCPPTNLPYPYIPTLPLHTYNDIHWRIYCF